MDPGGFTQSRFQDEAVLRDRGDRVTDDPWETFVRCLGIELTFPL